MVTQQHLELDQDTKAYGEGWKTFRIIPAGSRAPILDKVSDERGACVIVLWEGEELAIDVNDLPWPDTDEW